LRIPTVLCFVAAAKNAPPPGYNKL
jgi:hypothetical protein